MRMCSSAPSTPAAESRAHRPAPARISHQASSREGEGARGCKAQDESTPQAYLQYVEDGDRPATQQTWADSTSQQMAGGKCGLALFLTLLLCAAGAAGAAAPAADAPPPWEDGSWDSGFVTTTDGVRIHYFEAGPGDGADPAGPSLLFVPGWTLPGQIFEPQVRHFAGSHRVVAMDPRSQGLSDQPDDGHYPKARGRDVQAVIEGLDLAPVVPVCWSLAVGECVAMVEQFGTEHLAGLVIVDGLAGGEWNPATSPSMVRSYSPLPSPS